MSKLSALGSFFKHVATIAPVILPFTPLAPIAPAVTAAIQEAEALHQGTGTGPEKLAHVIAIAQDAAAAANAQAGHTVINVDVVGQATAQAVSTIVTITNLAHDATAPATN